MKVRHRPLLPFLALLMVLLALAGSFADAARRSGGGFGGSRSYRSSPLRNAPSYRAPTLPRATPAPNVRPSGPLSYRPRTNFFFLPFFGFNPFGFGYGFGAPGIVSGFFSLILNLVLIVAAIAFVAWLVRRMRRS